MGAPMMLLPVELSLDGIARARRELDGTEAIVRGGVAVDSGGRQPGVAQHSVGGHRPDIVAVYEHALTVPNSQTPKLLELFAREDPLTPEEIGIELGNGKPFSKAQGRAFVRNLSRMEGNLIKEGRIARRVLSKHFGQYEQEHAGRYGLSDEDKTALRAHLGI
jgi:hypothetical protein